MSIYGQIYAAIEGGGNAYFDGKPLKDNPHEDRRLRSAWTHGWLDACRSTEKLSGYRDGLAKGKSDD